MPTKTRKPFNVQRARGRLDSAYAHLLNLADELDLAAEDSIRTDLEGALVALKSCRSLVDVRAAELESKEEAA